MKYFGNWSNYQEMLESWGTITKQPIPTDDEVLFASYGSENYEGDALVIFTHHGKLYEVHGGHCSCYGLSETSYGESDGSQWEPEETSWDAIKMERVPTSDQHTHEAILAFETLLAAAK